MQLGMRTDRHATWCAARATMLGTFIVKIVSQDKWNSTLDANPEDEEENAYTHRPRRGPKQETLPRVIGEVLARLNWRPVPYCRRVWVPVIKYFSGRLKLAHLE